MNLTKPIPLRKVKSSATSKAHGGRAVHILECGHEVPIYTVQDRDRDRRRCYPCWREEPLPQ